MAGRIVRGLLVAAVLAGFGAACGDDDEQSVPRGWSCSDYPDEGLCGCMFYGEQEQPHSDFTVPMCTGYTCCTWRTYDPSGPPTPHSGAGPLDSSSGEPAPDFCECFDLGPAECEEHRASVEGYDMYDRTVVTVPQCPP